MARRESRVSGVDIRVGYPSGDERALVFGRGRRSCGGFVGARESLGIGFLDRRRVVFGVPRRRL